MVLFLPEQLRDVFLQLIMFDTQGSKVINNRDESSRPFFPHSILIPITQSVPVSLPFLKAGSHWTYFGRTKQNEIQL